MVGENKLELNSQAMCKAVEFYLNSIFKSPCTVKSIKSNSNGYNSTYVIEFTDRGEEQSGKELERAITEYASK